MKYSIDTSAILNSWVRAYPPDIFPRLWTRLDELIEKGILVAIEEVIIELERKDDEVYKWAKKRENMFVPINEDIQLAVKNILRTYGKLIDQRKSRSRADPWVIALAQVRGFTVITSEKPTNRPNRPHIPDVCSAMNIPCIDMVQFFREQKFVFS